MRTTKEKDLTKTTTKSNRPRTGCRAAAGSCPSSWLTPKEAVSVKPAPLIASENPGNWVFQASMIPALLRKDVANCSWMDYPAELLLTPLASENSDFWAFLTRDHKNSLMRALSRAWVRGQRSYLGVLSLTRG